MTSDTLDTILSHIAQTLRQLNQTLADEFSALAADNFEQIQELAQNKNALFETLEKLEQQRQACLNKAGFGLNSEDVIAYLTQQKNQSNEKTKQTWQEIETLTHTCRQQNSKNGLLLEKNRRRIEKALSILKGQIPDNQATYTANGTTSSTSPSHTFAKA